jgi:hypothetical protein
MSEHNRDGMADARESRDGALVEGIKLGMWVTIAMDIMIAANTVVFDATRNHINDGTWEGFQGVLIIFPFLLVIPVSVCAGVSTTVLHTLARRGALAARHGAAIGALVGVAWGLAIHVTGNRELSTGNVEAPVVWIGLLLTLAVLVWSWHGWRMARYILSASEGNA